MVAREVEDLYSHILLTRVRLGGWNSVWWVVCYLWSRGGGGVEVYR